MRMLRQFSFRASDIKITKSSDKSPVVVPKELPFGQHHTRHMFYVDNVIGSWGTPQIVPYAPVQLDPFCSTLHYAISCFEGMKAYKDKNGGLRLFRPMLNMARFQKACNRLSLPAFEEVEMLKCIEEFVKLEKDHIPTTVGESLYVRPFAFSIDDTLGVKPPSKSRIMVVAGPVGNYFSLNFKPITLVTCNEYTRGTPSSAASFKIASNYAPTIKISGDFQQSVKADQVLWLNGDDILEVGASNIFFIIKDKAGNLELITPPLDGSILPGVTRDSIIQLEQEKSRFKVSVRPITLTEVWEAHQDGRLVEVFGAGTAVVVSPVSTISKHRLTQLRPRERS